jgi:hypothetical protein
MGHVLQHYLVAHALENRDKYSREGHEVTHIELPGQAMWAAEVGIDESIWDFFAKHPRQRT